MPMAGRDPLKQRLAKQRYYEANKAVVKARAKVRTQITRKKVKAWLLDYLRVHHCVDCGESNPVVLEFDHVRGTKHFNIGEVSSRNMSLNRVMNEVEKCEVRCANCHRQKTYRDAGRTHRD